MTVAEVVGVRVALGAQVVEPDLRPPVGVGQGDVGPFGAAGAGALAVHDSDPITSPIALHGARRYVVAHLRVVDGRPDVVRIVVEHDLASAANPPSMDP